MINKIFTFLKYKDKGLLIEAYLLLAWARYKKTTQFSKMAPALGNHMKETKQELTAQQRDIARKISSALYLMSQYTFWESECLVKAAAGMKMLERRGIESTLYLGTAKDETGLVAHAWLRSGNYYVSGAEGKHKFTVVATFAKKILIRYYNDSAQEVKVKDITYFVKQIHAYAGNKLYATILAMTFVGVLEGVGVLLLIPMISMTGIVDFGIENSAYIKFLSFIEDIPTSISIPIILFIYFMVVVGYNIIDRKIVMQNAVIQNGFLRTFRAETYKNLMFTKWEFFVKNRKSDLINLIMGEVAKTTGGTNAFLQFIASLIFTIIQVGLAFWLSPTITSFVLLSGFLLVFLNRKFLKRSLELGNTNFQLGKDFFAGITDQMNGIKDIKSNSVEKSRLEWFDDITRKIEKEQYNYMKLRTTSQFYYKTASALFIALFIFISLSLFKAQAGQLMLIIIIFARLWPRVAGIQGSLEQIAATLPSFNAVKQFQQECKKYKEFHLREDEEIPRLQIENDIQCQQVSFRYNTSENRYALQNINITLPANKMTAIVGRSGAGKSTLIDLIMGLNKPEEGSILIDGQPLSNDNLLSLRSSLSYVPQEPFLFNASIRENLLLVEPKATDHEMWEALTFASAAEFVQKLPNGLDTFIGDRGIKLSGGERQRIVLARAILRKPAILVLDEATSSLDTESESKIQEAIDRLKGQMTIIVIAHRFSTIRNADQVLVLEDGKIVQQGGFIQLSKEKNKVFHKLLGKQLEVL